MFFVAKPGCQVLAPKFSFQIFLDQLYLVNSFVNGADGLIGQGGSNSPLPQVAKHSSTAVALVLEPGCGVGLGELLIVEITVLFAASQDRFDVGCIRRAESQAVPKISGGEGAAAE